MARRAQVKVVGLLGVVLLGAGLLVGCQPIVATFVVNSTVDAVDAHPGDGVCRTAAGTCTLRAAIQEANATTGSVEIDLAAGATYPLSISGTGEDAAATGDLDINNSVTIQGNGAVVDGQGQDRVFDIGAEAGDDPQVTINRVTVTDGAADVAGTADGGGIELVRGSLTMNSSTVSFSYATGEGGGIYAADGAGALALYGVTLYANQANGGGGALSEGGSATVSGSNFSSNSVNPAVPLTPGGQGEAVHQRGGALTLDLDAVGDNGSETANGTTIASDPGSTLTMVDDSVGGNWASGGVIASAGATSIRQSTLDNPNSGAALDRTAGTLSIGGSIVVGSPACAAPVSSIGYDLISDTSCAVSAVGDRPGVVPQLSALVPHGGPTPSIAPLTPEGIDAVPVGTPELCTGNALLDQRFVIRPVGSGCDIGAVETDLASHTFTVDDPGSGDDAEPGDGTCATSGGACTLPAAIEEANASPGPDVIDIAPGVDPVLASGALTIDDSVTIHGAGATISGTNNYGYVGVEPGGALQVAIDHLTFVGPAGSSGIAWENPGSLSVADVTFSGLTSGYGGGMYLTAGSVDVRDSTFVGNVSTGNFEVHCPPGECDGDGSAIYQTGGSLTVSNSTFSGNSPTPGFQGFDGPEISVHGGTAVLSHVTMSDNPAYEEVGGAGSLTVTGSAIDGFCSLGGATESYNATSATAEGCALSGTGDLVGGALGLGALAGNGGPTQTRLPVVGSPLVDAIPVGTAGVCDSSTPLDQRGLPRPSGPACDIGSVERQPSDP